MEDKWNDELRRAYDRGYWDRDRELREHADRRSGERAGRSDMESERRSWESGDRQEWRGSYAADYPPGEREGTGDYGYRSPDRRSGWNTGNNEERARHVGLRALGDYGGESYRREDRRDRDDRSRYDEPGDRYQDGSRLSHRRDFVERTTDEVRSWFGDEHALARRRMDDVRDNYEREHRLDDLRRDDRTEREREYQRRRQERDNPGF
jgi:hypothetical protein